MAAFHRDHAERPCLSASLHSHNETLNMPNPWTVQMGNVTLASAPAMAFPEQLAINPLLDKLSEAIRIANDMATTARMCIQKLAIANPTQGNLGNAEVADALSKYFNLYPSHSLYMQTVHRILRVFRAMETGLSAEYKLFVYSAPTDQSPMAGAAAFVSVDKSANYALGKFFLKDHIDWDEFQRLAKGDRSTAPSEEIHLKYEMILREPADVIARTLVHEASHKWAYTTDVCYKFKSVAKLNNDLTDALALGYQPQVERMTDHFFAPEDRAGKLNPIAKGTAKVQAVSTDMKVKSANRMDLEMQKLSQAEMWVKNADSYAWCARRLWKKEVSIAISASQGQFMSVRAL